MARYEPSIHTDRTMMKTSHWNPFKLHERQPPRPRTERRHQPRMPYDTWTPSLREDFRKQEFLNGIEVLESDWGKWQDTQAAFLQR